MNDQPRRRRRIAPRQDGAEAAPVETPVETIEAPSQVIPRDEAQRPEPRQEPREESSRELAARLTDEILERETSAGDFVDRFPMPAGGPPDGWAYQWRKKSVMGYEDRSYSIQLATNGWRPVPAERHPEYMPVGGNHLAIERDGMVLMEIPKAVVEHREKASFDRARDQIKRKQQQLSVAPPGTFGRDNKGNSMVNVRRDYGPLTIPTDRAK